MTIRDFLNKKKQTATMLYFGSFILLIVSVFSSFYYRPIIIIAVIAGAASFTSLIYLLFGIRCPKCHNLLGMMISYFGGPFKMSAKVNYCPYCGAKLDDKV